MNCSKCGKFMKGSLEIDDYDEPEVYREWKCKCGRKHYEHLYFKSYKLNIGDDE